MLDYLKRIGITEGMGVNISSLKLIQKQHLLTVPFENLDIHIHKKVKTDIEFLYEKIVCQNRGGICYELNWLLAELLKCIGFEVKVLGGKVLEEDGSYFDHMLLVVELDDKEYLVDVGYGDNFLEPLLFETDIVQMDKKGLFRVDKIDDLHFALKKYNDESDDFKTEYVFINKERQIEDFQKRIEYFTKSDKSIFKKNLFCSLEKEYGRVSLKHDKLIITENGSKMTEGITSSEKYIHHMKDAFRIGLKFEERKKLEALWQELT